MSRDFLTSKKSDPEFKNLLWGQASNGKIARTLESADVNSSLEQVRFELVDRVPVSNFILLKKLFKWQSLVWSLGPLLLILIKNTVTHQTLNIGFILLNIWAVTNLHLGIGLLSDVYDHIRGLDRILPRSNHVALQSGWMTAKQLNWMSWLLIVSGILLGLPSLFAQPNLFLILTPLVFLTLLGFVMDKIGLKYRAWSEWVVFLMFGPLLTVGFQISIGGVFDWQALAIGVLTGWLAVMGVHYKNFASLMINQRAGFQNTIARLGFDYGKRFLILVLWSYLILSSGYQLVFGNWIWLTVGLLLLAPLMYKFSRFIVNLKSSIGSDVRDVQSLGHKLNLVALTLLVLQSIVEMSMDLING